MSGYNYQPDSFDDLGGGQDETPKGLRAMFEEQLRVNRELTDRLNKQEREKTLGEALAGAGLAPGVASLIPTDVDPVKWVEENKSLFGQQAVPHTQTEPEIQVAPDDDAALQAERAAQESIYAARESGVPAVTQEVVDQIRDMSEADLLKKIAEEQTLVS